MAETHCENNLPEIAKHLTDADSLTVENAKDLIAACC
jgi:hypothetical protein